MNKRLATIVLSLLLVFSVNVTCFADTSTPESDWTQKYDIKDATSIPDGVVPTVINSEEDFIKLINNSEVSSESIPTEITSEELVTPEDNNMGLAAIADKTVSYRKDVALGYLGIGGYIRTDVSIVEFWDPNASRYFYKDCASTSSYSVGFTLGNTYSNEYVDVSSYDNLKQAKVRVVGTVEYYIILEGIGKVYTAPIDYTYYISLK